MSPFAAIRFEGDRRILCGEPQGRVIPLYPTEDDAAFVAAKVQAAHCAARDVSNSSAYKFDAFAEDHEGNEHLLVGCFILRDESAVLLYYDYRLRLKRSFEKMTRNEYLYNHDKIARKHIPLAYDALARGDLEAAHKHLTDYETEWQAIHRTRQEAIRREIADNKAWDDWRDSLVR